MFTKWADEAFPSPKMPALIPAQLKTRKRPKAYSFINSRGEIERFGSIRAFSQKSSMSYPMARSLHCGMRVRLRGFCSTSSKPKAKKFRDRFMTVLVNTRTEERCILGPSVKKFAADHGLSLQGVSELVNRRVQIYRHWVLGKTLDAVNLDTPASSLQNASSTAFAGFCTPTGL